MLVVVKDTVQAVRRNGGDVRSGSDRTRHHVGVTEDVGETVPSSL